jgi:hypothetical protein
VTVHGDWGRFDTIAVVSTPPPEALAPIDRGPDQARLQSLEATLKTRQHELAERKSELGRLQSRYLQKVGGLYARLAELEAEVLDAEVRAGLRLPPEPEPEVDPAGDTAADAASCSNAAAPSDGLKKIFRDLARTIHPDLAMDDPARLRRHSLMAEANRAYADRDEDRLRLILHAWEQDLADLDPAARDDAARVQARVAMIEDWLRAIDREVEELRGSAICRLQQKIDDAKAQGWDLFAEMVMQVQRDISRATARLAFARQRFGVRRSGAQKE